MGSHAVFLVVALHKGEEVAEVAEEVVVDVWKLLEQVSHICPRDIIGTLYRHTTRHQNRLILPHFSQQLFPVQKN